MARGSFGSGDRLTRNAPSGFDGTEPFTAAVWGYCGNVTGNHYGFYTGPSGDLTECHYMVFGGATGGDPVLINSHKGLFDNAYAATTSGFSANTWHHACGKFIANNSRAVLIDGGSKGTNSTNQLVAAADTVAIGATAFNGSVVSSSNLVRVAEFGLWNVELTDEEVESLAQGFSPLLIRPDSLISYLPMYDGSGDAIDVIDGATWTLTGTVGDAEHPEIIQPKGMDYSGVLAQIVRAANAASAAWAAQAATRAMGTKSLTANTASAAWSAIAASRVMGAVTKTANVASVAWSAIAASTLVGVVRTTNTVSATWSAVSPTRVMGTVTRVASAVSAAWSAVQADYTLTGGAKIRKLISQTLRNIIEKQPG